MEIEQIDNGDKGIFQAKEGEVIAGKMVYTWFGPNKLIIDHTEVNPDFAGKGVGKKLLLELVKFAREKKIKVVPYCPFAKSVFDKTEDIRDVL